MSDYPVVGRNGDIEISKYLIEVHGRQVIDYEKLKQEEPELYQRVLENDKTSDIESEL